MLESSTIYFMTANVHIVVCIPWYYYLDAYYGYGADLQSTLVNVFLLIH